MATLLQITNKVLKRLREDTVTDLTDDYVNLVASFVCDIAAEVQDETVWEANDHEVDVTVVANTATYTLTGTTDKSMLLYNPDGSPQVWAFTSSSSDSGIPLQQISPTQYQEWYQVNRANTVSFPQYFMISKSTDNDTLSMTLWPTPSASAYVRARFNTPQAELDPDTDASTEIEMNERLVRLGALYMALNERGEEIGEPGGVAETRYLKALGAAVEDEIRNRERTLAYDWFRN